MSCFDVGRRLCALPERSGHRTDQPKSWAHADAQACGACAQAPACSYELFESSGRDAACAVRAVGADNLNQICAPKTTDGGA